MDLRRILRVVTHSHMAWIAKPGHEMGIDLCSCSRIEQRVQIDFADVGSAQISIRLRLERIPCAGVVGSLCLKSSGGLTELLVTPPYRFGTRSTQTSGLLFRPLAG